MSNNETLELEYVEIIKETPMAILFEFAEDEEVWLPKSRITVIEEDYIVEVPEWLAMDKEIEDYAV